MILLVHLTVTYYLTSCNSSNSNSSSHSHKSCERGVTLLRMMQAMSLEIHGVFGRDLAIGTRRTGHHTVTSIANIYPQVTSSFFDSLGLSLSPSRGAIIGEEQQYYELLPSTSCGGEEWKFCWQWNNSGTNMDDRVLERTSYKPVERFLRGVGGSVLCGYK